MNDPRANARRGKDPADDRPRDRSKERHRDVFGQVLPEGTRDEGSVGWGEREYDDDERLRREVPPHHG